MPLLSCGINLILSRKTSATASSEEKQRIHHLGIRLQRSITHSLISANSAKHVIDLLVTLEKFNGDRTDVINWEHLNLVITFNNTDFFV